jgi:site-specific DNA-methyltransferase (adenine-specific)
MGFEPDVIIHGDSREVLKGFPDESVDSVVTDPPAGIAFMAKEWDDPDAWKAPITKHGYSDGGNRVPAPLIGSSARNPNCRKCKKHKRGWKDVPGCQCEEPDFDTVDDRKSDRDAFVGFLREIMAECLRVLKPGGHALVWAIPRTSHWTALALEEAGFEIRDCVYHVFGSGFPKSLNVGKAIDKMKGGGPSPEAETWDGWGTSLKPAVECWWLCRKPIKAQNVTAQVLKTGTGAINIDGTRVAGTPEPTRFDPQKHSHEGWRMNASGAETAERAVTAGGRWPSNLVLSHSAGCKKIGTRTVPAPLINRFTDGMKPFGEGAGHPYETTGGGTEEIAVYECSPGCPVAEMDAQSGEQKSGVAVRHRGVESGGYGGTVGRLPEGTPDMGYGDAGGASRYFQTFEPDVPFFYTAKASKADKNDGLEEFEAKAQHKIEDQTISTQSNRRCKTCGLVKFGLPHCECEAPEWEETSGSKSANYHPTVKSTKLMRYLVKLVTPKGGIVLDPFMGSGSTPVAAIMEGMRYIGIEREADYVKIAQTRVGSIAKREETRAAEKDIFDLMMVLDD